MLGHTPYHGKPLRCLRKLTHRFHKLKGRTLPSGVLGQTPYIRKLKGKALLETQHGKGLRPGTKRRGAGSPAVREGPGKPKLHKMFKKIKTPAVPAGLQSFELLLRVMPAGRRATVRFVRQLDDVGPPARSGLGEV